MKPYNQRFNYHPYLETQLKQIEKQLANTISELQDDGIINEQVIKKLIRDKALEVYKIGINYVCSYFGIEPFMAAEDFAPIGKITDDTYRRWAYGGRLDSALIALTSITLAKAIKSKALQLYVFSPYVGAIMRMKMFQPLNKLDSPIDPLDMTSDLPDIPSPQITKTYYIWHSEHDNLVCPVCSDLDGQEWNLEDGDQVLTPIIDSHENCRCRIDLETRQEEDLIDN